MPERFEIYIAYKKRYIHTLPFLFVVVCTVRCYATFQIVLNKSQAVRSLSLCYISPLCQEASRGHYACAPNFNSKTSRKLTISVWNLRIYASSPCRSSNKLRNTSNLTEYYKLLLLHFMYLVTYAQFILCNCIFDCCSEMFIYWLLFALVLKTSAHQQMRDSEREHFYDDIAHVIQNIKKIILPVGFEPDTVKHLAA